MFYFDFFLFLVCSGFVDRRINKIFFFLMLIEEIIQLPPYSMNFSIHKFQKKLKDLNYGDLNENFFFPWKFLPLIVLKGKRRGGGRL